jgi:anti-anti-sigma factor
MTLAASETTAVKAGASSGTCALKINESGRSVLVRVDGPLDLEHSSAFLSPLDSLCTSGRRVVVDLLHAEYVDSSGVRAILQLQTLLANVRGELRLVIRPGSRVERVFALLRLLDQLEVYPSVSEAWEGRTRIA